MNLPKVIRIDEIYYTRDDAIPELCPTLPYVICRTQNAGVFAGALLSKDGQDVILLNARRLWYWKGAATLSQAAMEGFSLPNECKFPCEVARIELLQGIEILSCTKKAQLSIASVPIWAV